MFDSWTLYALMAAATVFAGISKGGFGSGAAFASSAVLSLVLPPTIALGIMLPLLMLIDVATLRPYWQRWSWPEARLLILAGIPGVALGAALFTVANDDVLRFLIGAVGLSFVAYRLWPRSAPRRQAPLWVGWIAGLAAGFTSFISHAGGPPVAAFLLSRGLSKTTYQATTVLIFWAINVAKVVPFAFLGVFTLETLQADLWLAPFALVGAWLGVKAHHMVSDRLFFGLTYVMLVLTGLKLIWDALT